MNVLERVFKAIGGGPYLGVRKGDWFLDTRRCILLSGYRKMFKPSSKTTADKTFATAQRKDVHTWRKFSRYFW